jgi:hypothetical protein
MGGYGSGQYYRYSSRDTTEASKRIDIRWLRKQGYLKPNTSGKLTWDRGGEPSGWIRYSMFENRMELKYRIQFNGGDWQDVNETVYFDETVCNYGGTRKWLICPHCGRRVALLYGTQRLFLCRKCSDLVYASQMESDLDRLARKADKIRSRLEWEPGFLNGSGWKPKNMHWQTFYRLQQAESDLQDRVSGEYLAKFGMMM